MRRFHPPPMRTAVYAGSFDPPTNGHLWMIQRGLELGVDYAMTVSCYDPDAQGRACGHCDACQLRRKGFRENGIDDPGAYQ